LTVFQSIFFMAPWGLNTRFAECDSNRSLAPSVNSASSTAVYVDAHMFFF